MTNKPTEQWEQALDKGWKGCASVRISLEKAQPGDVILAKYTRPKEAGGPPPEYTDSLEIFVMLDKPDGKFPRDCRALRITQLSADGQPNGSVSWGSRAYLMVRSFGYLAPARAPASQTHAG